MLQRSLVRLRPDQVVDPPVVLAGPRLEPPSRQQELDDAGPRSGPPARTLFAFLLSFLAGVARFNAAPFRTFLCVLISLTRVLRCFVVQVSEARVARTRARLNWGPTVRELPGTIPSLLVCLPGCVLSLLEAVVGTLGSLSQSLVPPLLMVVDFVFDCRSHVYGGVPRESQEREARLARAPVSHTYPSPTARSPWPHC